MNMNHVAEAIKFLVEFGGIWKVDEDYYVTDIDGEPIKIIRKKQDVRPLKVLHENMVYGEYSILNPYAEPNKLNNELKWFYDSKSTYLGYVVKQLILEIIEHTPKIKIKKETIETLESIQPSELIEIVYVKKQKSAKLQSRLLMQPADYSISETQMKQLRKVFNILLDNNDLTSFDTECQFKKMPRYTSFFHCFLKIMEVLEEHVEKYLENQLDLDALRSYLTNTEKYYKFASWCVSTSPPAEIKVDKPQQPFGTPQVPNNMQPPSALSTVEDEGTGVVTVHNGTAVPAPTTQRQPYDPMVGQMQRPMMGMQGQMPMQGQMLMQGQLPMQGQMYNPMMGPQRPMLPPYSGTMQYGMPMQQMPQGGPLRQY